MSTLSLLSVTLVYCGQTLRWIRMPLGTDVGPGHIVLWRPSSPRKVAQQPPLFGPCLLRPNDWMVQDAIWYGGRPWPRRHCASWNQAPPWERGTVRLCGFRLISTSGLGVGASRVSCFAIFAISCTRYRVSRPLGLRLTLNNTRRRYFRFFRNWKSFLTAKWW